MNKLYLLSTRGRNNKLSAALAFILLIIFFTVASQPVRAQLSLTNVAPSATIDFSNTMQTAVGSNPSTAFTAAGFSPAPATAGRLNSNAWASTGWSDGDLAFGGTQAGGNDYSRGPIAAAITQGGIYAYTGAPNSVANPALMIQPGGSDFTPGTLTLKIQNNGTTLINQLAVAYNIYVRNDQLRSQSFNLSYSSDNITYTPVAAVDYATPTTADALGWVVVAGGPSRSTNITGINIAPSGGVFYIRWTSDDVSGSGSRDEIGLDDISLTGNFVTACTPPTIAASLNATSNVLFTQMDIDVARGNGTGGLMVVAVEGTTLGSITLSTNPTSGITYHANSNYGTGAAIGNGFVVYNLVVPGVVGTPTPFTMTGLQQGTFYTLYFFEYNISVPCYDGAPNVEDQQTATSTPTLPQTSATDLFRSAVTGNWADARTWQHSTDGGGSWNISERTPTSASAGITIMLPHTVDITCPASMDQVSVAGLLTLSNDGKINLNNGAGYDIDIISGGTLRTQSTTNYSLTFVYSGGPQINVSNGGKITLGNNSSAPGYSALGYTSGLVNWNNGSILEWNSTDPFITAGSITYFPDAPVGTVPVFRISRSPSLQPGANTNTGWNGLLEVNANLTLKLSGIKTFRNGIIGSANLFQDDNCGAFNIAGDVADLGGTGVINLNAGGLYITSTSFTRLNSDKVINQTAGLGTIELDGTLNCQTSILSGTANFFIAPVSVQAPSTGLIMASPYGITPSGSGPTFGNIQTATRTFDVSTSYQYTASVNQVTGLGLPATVHALYIANVGSAGNNTVSLSRPGTTTISTALGGTLKFFVGLFSIGAGNNISLTDSDTRGIAATGGGDFSPSSSGTVTFLGAALMAGPINFYPDVYLTPPGGNLGVNFGSSSIVHGLLQLNANSFVNVNAPSYAAGSLLKYNLNTTYGRRVEWSTGNGNGYPYNVQVSNSTVLSPAKTAGFDVTIFKTAGNVTIDNGSAIYLDEGGFNMQLPLTVGGNLLINGSLSGSQVIPGDIILAGNWTRSSTGNFYPNNRAVFFNGSGNSVITANNGETFDYLYLTKNALGNTVSLADNIRVSKEFGINTGTLDLQAKNVTLLSSATATATFSNFGAGTPAAAAINYSGTGRFVVDRYIPTGVSHAKSWQFLATPVNGGQTVNAAWQEGATSPNQNLFPGYGTQLTSNVAGAATFPSPGFDVLTPIGPSVKTYDPATNAWIGIANTTIPVYNQKGYMVFVRGDRSVSFGQPAVATILRTTGKLFDPVSNIPPVTNVAANQFESIGNPYASAIDFSNDAAIVKSANVQKVFYVWDPKLGGAYGYGAFQTFTKGAGTDYTVSPGGGSYGASGSVNNIIQSGQAFFVHTVGGTGTVTFTEAAKTSGSSITFKPVNIISDKQIRNNLYVITGGEPVLIDGVLNQFDAGYSNKTDELDALKFSNSGENIGISRDNKVLAVERRAMIVRADTIFYNLGQMKANQYQFEFTPDNLSITGLEAFLEDSYLGTRTSISMADTTRFNFNVTNEVGSYAAGRFRLVFIQKNTPVKYTDIHAEQQDDDIAVNWKVSDQAGVDHYELERSADGINFTIIHTEAVTGNNIAFYNWVDTDPLNGANFYRVRSLSLNGEAVYSKQVNVFIGKGGTNFVIYPNPVKEGIIGLQLYQLPAAVYQVRLYNSGGQVILLHNLYHSGGNSLQQIKAGTSLAKGIYKLEISSPEGLRQVKKVVIE